MKRAGLGKLHSQRVHERRGMADEGFSTKRKLQLCWLFRKKNEVQNVKMLKVHYFSSNLQEPWLF